MKFAFLDHHNNNNNNNDKDSRNDKLKLMTYQSKPLHNHTAFFGAPITQQPPKVPIGASAEGFKQAPKHNTHGTHSHSHSPFANILNRNIPINSREHFNRSNPRAYHIAEHFNNEQQQTAASSTVKPPGMLLDGGLLIQNSLPGALVEAVDPGNERLRYGIGLHHDGKLRMYVPEADGSSSINLSVMKDSGNRIFDDVLTLKRQDGADDAGWAMHLNNVNEVRMNGQSVDVQAVVDRLQFQTFIDKVMNVNGASDKPFITLNPDTRSVGITALEPKGRMTLGNGGGAGAVGGDMVFEVGNTTDGQQPGFSAVNFNGYYDRGDKVFDPERARWRVGVLPDDRFFIDAWKKDWRGAKQVLVANPNEDTVDLNGNLRFSTKYTGFAEAAADRAEIVSDPNARRLTIVPPQTATNSTSAPERVLQVNGSLSVGEKIITNRVVLPSSTDASTSLAFDSASGRVLLSPPLNSDFVVGNGTDNRLVMRSDGKIGVGLGAGESPAAQLHVGGAVQIGGFVLSPENGGLVVRRANDGAIVSNLGAAN